MIYENMFINLETSSEEETKQLGETIGLIIKRNFELYKHETCIIAMLGELGSGKTYLSKGIARGLGINENDVTSPTFTIINEYKGEFLIFHIDFYRLNCQDEVIDLGFEEYLNGGGVMIIEWADRIPDVIPKNHLEIKIEIKNFGKRKITISPYGENYKKLFFNNLSFLGVRNEQGI